MVGRAVAAIVLVAASGLVSGSRGASAEPNRADSASGVAPATGEACAGARMRCRMREDGRGFLTRRTGVILLAGAALTGASLAFEDPDRTADRLSGKTWEHVADLGNLYGNGATLGLGALAMVAAGGLSGEQNLRAAGWDAARALGYSFAIVGGLKVTVHRTRPDGGRYAFPSGHAAGAFAMAPVLSRHFGLRAALPAYALAFATSVGRLEDRKHYLSDVVFGAAVGSAVGLAVSRSDEVACGVRLSFAPGRAGVSVEF